MKTLFLKNGMPIATAVLAIVGVFVTTSMQSSSSTFVLKTGYILDVKGDCDVPVTCSTVPKPQVCRISYPNGVIAYEKTVLGNCINPLFRPE